MGSRQPVLHTYCCVKSAEKQVGLGKNTGQYRYCNCLNTVIIAIQPDVDMMKKTVASRFKSKNADSSKGRTRSISSNVRPSRKRGTESISGSCEICGSTSWDSDEIRGETSCSECGFVASENMIDPGA